MSLILYDFATPFKKYTGDYAYENPALYYKYIRKISENEDYKWLPRFFGKVSKSPILIGLYDTLTEEWYEYDYLEDYDNEEDYDGLYEYFDSELEWDDEQKIDVEEILCSTEGSAFVGAI